MTYDENLKHLQVTQGIAPGIENVAFNIHPKSDKQVDNNGRPHCYKSDIDKIFADGGSSDSKAFANCSANTEYMPFNKMPEIFHITNL